MSKIRVFEEISKWQRASQSPLDEDIAQVENAGQGAFPFHMHAPDDRRPVWTEKSWQRGEELRWRSEIQHLILTNAGIQGRWSDNLAL